MRYNPNFIQKDFMIIETKLDKYVEVERVSSSELEPMLVLLSTNHHHDIHFYHDRPDDDGSSDDDWLHYFGQHLFQAMKHYEIQNDDQLLGLGILRLEILGLEALGRQVLGLELLVMVQL